MPPPPFPWAVQNNRPTARRSTPRSGNPRKTTKKGVTKKPVRVIEYIKVPKHWFTDQLNHSMKTVVRPPTARTRRKQQTIELRMPEQIFIDLLKPIDECNIAGMEWSTEEKLELKPTLDRKTFKEYKYIVKKPATLDELWRLEKNEVAPLKRKKNKQGEIVAFRRGKGCARLHLSAAAAERGQLTDLLAQVTGNVIVKLKVPKLERVMPTFWLTFGVSTLNQSGDVIWANKYESKTAIVLKKRMRQHLKEMIEDPEYPTLDAMRPALTMGGEAVREHPVRPVAGLLQ